ncbi:hypothetical protein HPP92_009644 [Vanilla planifolia]|uniref:Uncharacterized protein n=1 Tax=Vanilla planifolia TaxID=51239 RepID=A0A835RAN1_VANPL|nr:hypothetical protein HPP92_009644 [Vanilla planifolia]
MAAMATSIAVGGLEGSSFSFSVGFARPQTNVRTPFSRKLPSGRRFTCQASFPRDWLRTDLTVIGFGLVGWIAPSSIPVINGKSLTGLFFESIATELSHWPTGPALTSQFWLQGKDRGLLLKPIWVLLQCSCL